MICRRAYEVRQHSRALIERGDHRDLGQGVLVSKLFDKFLQRRIGYILAGLLTESWSFITIARFGRMSCFRESAEKSTTMVKYLITAFRVID